MGTKNISKREHTKGFTIVELIVVVTVIAILAGISVIGYGTWRKDVTQKQLSSDLVQAASAMESAKNFGTGYPSAIPTSFSASDDVTVSYSRGNTKSFCIQAVNQKYPDVIYFYDSLQKGKPSLGSCPAVFTNLAHNPQPTDATYYKSSSNSVAVVSFEEGAQGKAARSTRAAAGAYALYIERTTGGTMVAQAGDIYTIRFTAYSPVATTITSQVGYGVASSVVGGVTNSAVSLSAGVAKDVSYTFTLPTGFDGQTLFPKISWSAGAVGDYIEISKLMVTKGTYPSTASYADGSAGHGWVWDGAVNGSTSTGPSF